MGSRVASNTSTDFQTLSLLFLTTIVSSENNHHSLYLYIRVSDPRARVDTRSGVRRSNIAIYMPSTGQSMQGNKRNTTTALNTLCICSIRGRRISVRWPRTGPAPPAGLVGTRGVQHDGTGTLQAAMTFLPLGELT
jgi:hypothetical protein